jgi:hypothetical protein
MQSAVNACQLQRRKVVTPTAAALTVSPIRQAAFQAAGCSIALSDDTLTSVANLSVATGGAYPTTLVVRGGIKFESGPTARAAVT